MESNGLYIGIDIDENISQVCYYEREDMSVRSVSNNADSPEFINASSFSEIMTSQAHPEDVIYKMIQVLIERTKEQSGNSKVAMLSVCLRDYSPESRKVVTKALEMLGIPKEKYILIGLSEAFAYYAFNAEPALFAQGAVLYDYEKEGINAYFLQRISYKGNTVLREIDKSISSVRLLQVIKGELLLKDVMDEINEFIGSTLNEHKTSSVYLTGKGFDTSDIPQETLNFIGKKGYRIFAGQNLFVKGACICALAKASPIADPFRRAGIFKNLSLSGGADVSGGRYSSCILACKNRITTEVSVRTFFKGESVTSTVIKPGSNIDESTGELECILTDKNIIELELKELGANVPSIERIDLSDIRKRPDRMTRVGVSVNFPNEDLMELIFKDMGFGEACKSEGTALSVTVQMTGRKPQQMRLPESKGVILCESKRALVPYVFTDTGRNIYTIEELVQYLYENIWLIDDTVINNEFFKFIGEDTGNNLLADKLKNLAYSGATTWSLLLTLFRDVNYYTAEEVKIIEPILERIQNINPLLKKYSIAETYMKNNCLARAQKSFQEILEAPADEEMPESFYSKVHHNMGVCFAGMFMRKEAMECFVKAYKSGHNEESRKQALYAGILAGIEPNVPYGQLEYDEMKKEIEDFRQTTANDIRNEAIPVNERLEIIKSEYLSKHL